MATLGYVRVSTAHQTNDRQYDALTEFGVDKVFADKISGAKFDRKGLNELLAYARPGDVVVVASLDRLGRSLSQVVSTANDLHERGIVLKTIKESIDYSTSVGRMLAGIFGSLAEYERALINERAADARAAAAARGKQTGRPAKLDVDQARQLRSLRAAGESVADLCRSFKVSRATVYRALEASGGV
jgi:DNA invertase Pin-like site-specific DNA recombinase